MPNFYLSENGDITVEVANSDDIKNNDSSSNAINDEDNKDSAEQTQNDEIKTITLVDVEINHDGISEKGSLEEIKNELTEEKNEIAQDNLTIPVFSEWTQQMQQMQEKITNSSEMNKDVKNETLVKNQMKMRQKNYASPDCGAKILSANPEAQSASSVLKDKDEYMLSPCTDRIWFIVELCDSIQAQRVELANFELFSSSLKSVTISISNRFPAREWTLSGQFDAKSERNVQSFELRDIALFGKFVRVKFA